MNVALRLSLNILSICTGGGGLDLGVELAIPGARSVCMVEREAFAVAQLVAAMQQGLMAPAPVWSDARTFDGRAWRGAVDGLIGGIPCQPHSLAGKRLGEDDERDLWSTARRIIVQSGAWFVLIENVEGMLSSGGAERVYRDLGRLGFAREVGLFTAAEVGASHRRERTFILAVADARRTERWSLASGRDVGDRPEAGWDQGASRPPQSGQHVEDANGRHAPRWTSAPEQEAGGWPHAQSSGSGAGLSGVGLADPYGERLEGQRPDAGASGREDARRSAGLCDGAAVVDAAGIGRGEGVAEPGLRSGRDSSAGAERGRPSLHRQQYVADADGNEPTAFGRDAGEGEGASKGDGRPEHGAALSRGFGGALFPPGPSDIDGWHRALDRTPELEPAFRRVADGLASRLDIARVDRLRLLGNGVVPLEAAYAVRTLSARLAASGSAGAAELVGMMP